MESRAPAADRVPRGDSRKPGDHRHERQHRFEREHRLDAFIGGSDIRDLAEANGVAEQIVERAARIGDLAGIRASKILRVRGIGSCSRNFERSLIRERSCPASPVRRRGGSVACIGSAVVVTIYMVAMKLRMRPALS
jgi:hypothetical protein